MSLIDNNGNVVSTVNSIALEGYFVINFKWIGVFPIVRLLINATWFTRGSIKPRNYLNFERVDDAQKKSPLKTSREPCQQKWVFAK